MTNENVWLMLAAIFTPWTIIGFFVYHSYVNFKTRQRRPAPKSNGTYTCTHYTREEAHGEGMMYATMWPVVLVALVIRSVWKYLVFPLLYMVYAGFDWVVQTTVSNVIKPGPDYDKQSPEPKPEIERSDIMG